MNTVEATFVLPERISRGLLRGELERIGGVIREVDSKQIVTWLRETQPMKSSDLSSIPSLSPVGSVSSILNLGVTTMGFAIVLQQLSVIEKGLDKAQQVINEVDEKIDLSIYANFRAAIDLAINAFTMANSESRKVSAMHAINRFLEAEHQYTKLADMEIAKGSQIAYDYLSTLCLAFITEVRCYLELEELDTARLRLQEGAAVLRPRFTTLVNTLLTSNPAAYLHPALKEQIGLKRLTKVFQWLTPGIEDSEVFEMQRENLFKLAQNPKEWKASLPKIAQASETQTSKGITFFNRDRQSNKPSKSTSPISKDNNSASNILARPSEFEVYGRLLPMMTSMETIIETDNRLATYESEIETIHQLGMDFQQWRQIMPVSAAQGNEADLIYITVS